MDRTPGVVVLMGKEWNPDEPDARQERALRREAWLIGLGMALIALMVLSILMG